MASPQPSGDSSGLSSPRPEGPPLISRGREAAVGVGPPDERRRRGTRSSTNCGLQSGRGQCRAFGAHFGRLSEPRPHGRGYPLSGLRPWGEGLADTLSQSAPDCDDEIRIRFSPRRSSRFERILHLAALAVPMVQDAVDNTRLGNKGDDPHAGAASADQRICFEDLPDQARPRAAGFPGAVGIVFPGLSVGRETGAD